jgi:hypothetical protein
LQIAGDGDPMDRKVLENLSEWFEEVTYKEWNHTLGKPGFIENITESQTVSSTAYMYQVFFVIAVIKATHI